MIIIVDPGGIVCPALCVFMCAGLCQTREKHKEALREA